MTKTDNTDVSRIGEASRQSRLPERIALLGLCCFVCGLTILAIWINFTLDKDFQKRFMPFLFENIGLTYTQSAFDLTCAMTLGTLWISSFVCFIYYCVLYLRKSQ